MSSFNPGWYIRLQGEPWDLDDWLDAFVRPFDPFAIKDDQGVVFLGSSEFEELTEAQEVRERGKALVARLNGVMACYYHAHPVHEAGIMRCDQEGKRHTHIFAEMAAVGVRAKMRATACILDANGVPVAPPPPQPTKVQLWSSIAQEDRRVADLLEQHGRALDWYEVYKTLEFAEYLVGARRLPALLGSFQSTYKNIRETANFYRHARTHKPAQLCTLHDAIAGLHHIVLTVLSEVEKRRAQ